MRVFASYNLHDTEQQPQQHDPHRSNRISILTNIIFFLIGYCVCLFGQDSNGVQYLPPTTKTAVTNERRGGEDYDRQQLADGRYLVATDPATKEYNNYACVCVGRHKESVRNVTADAATQ